MEPEVSTMKNALAILAASAVLALGCTPTPPPPEEVATETPAPAANQAITEMDFESGDVDGGAVETEVPEAVEPETTPKTP
jgi:PBP1b-binding outer membrane lipoprotein LpoB